MILIAFLLNKTPLYKYLGWESWPLWWKGLFLCESTIACVLRPTRNMVQIFHYVPVDLRSGRIWFWSEDTTVLCYWSFYSSLVIFARIPLLVFVFLGFPAAVFVLLRRKTESLYEPKTVSDMVSFTILTIKQCLLGRWLCRSGKACRQQFPCCLKPFPAKFKGVLLCMCSSWQS